MEQVLNIDKEVFLFVNQFTGTVPVIDGIVRLVVNEYFVPVSLALIVVYLWFSKKEKNTALVVAALSVGLVNLIIAVLNQFVARARPFDDLPVNLLFYRPTDPSFPSNAAAVAFALSTAIFLYNKKLGVSALILASLYSLSRMYAGVHFPSDLAVGALLGVISVLFVVKFGRLVRLLTLFIEDLQRKLQLDFK